MPEGIKPHCFYVWGSLGTRVGTHSPNLSLNSFTDEETAARERKVLATVINPVSNEEAGMGLLLQGRRHLTGWG